MLEDAIYHGRTVTPYYVKGLALGVCAYLIGIHLWTWVFTASIFLGGRSDFRQLYTAGYMVRTGAAHALYDSEAQLRMQNRIVSPGEIPLPYIRPPFEALLFVPFSFMPYKAAYLSFLGFNLALLATCFRLMRSKMVHLAEIYAWLPAALFLAFLPVAAALLQGQDSILLLMLFVGGAIALENGHEMTAGLLVAAGLFKPQIALPIGLLFLLWRRWRFCLGFASSAAAASLLSIWTVGWPTATAYLKSVLAMSGVHLTTNIQFNYPLSPSVMPNLRGLFFGVMAGHFANFSIQIAILAATVIALVVTVKSGAGSRKQDSLMLAIITSAIVSYYLLIHDLSILLLPLIILLDRFVTAEATGNKSQRRILRMAAFMFIAPICMSYAPDHFFVVCLPMLGLLAAQIGAQREIRRMVTTGYERSAW